MLTAFRRFRRASVSEARGAVDHPLPIILYARAKIEDGRNIEWNLPLYTPAEERVLAAFSSRVIVPNILTKPNPLHRLCSPAWWMTHLATITEMYTRDRDFEAMDAAVNEVFETAHRMMNDIPGARAKASGSLFMGQKPNNTVAGRDINMLDVSVHSGGANVSVKPKNETPPSDDDDDLYSLPPPPPAPKRRAHRHRAPIREVINLLSSSPVRPVPTQTPAEKAAEYQDTLDREAPLMFTLAVNIMGTPVSVPVKMNMTLADTVFDAVARSVLKGVDATLFALADTDAAGLIWGESKWGEAWQKAVYEGVAHLDVNLVVNKKSRYGY